MNFLPIVTRELRVVARRKSTYRIRWITALIAIVVSFFFLFFYAIAQTPNVGGVLFRTLSNYTFGLCLFGGVFMTADCLSEEKREGTLGLLFLTDLKSYDVVLGKFMAGSLSAFYGLVAMLPVLSLPLLMGGVTGVEYWRMALALFNTLFFSLAAGIFVSALSRDSQRAMGNTLAIILLFVAVLPGLDKLGSYYQWPAAFGHVTSLNLFYPFLYAFASRYSNGDAFLYSLIGSHLIGWLLLVIAMVLLPRLWQDRPFKEGFKSRLAQWTLAGRTKNPAIRAQLLEQNPVLWLGSGSNSFRWAIWVLAIVSAGGCLSLCLSRNFFQPSGDTSFFALLIGLPVLFLFKIIVAIRAPKFFAEARQSGALELLLSTPLTSREIIRGQWRALRRLFIGPTLVVLMGMMAPFFFHSVVHWAARSAVEAPILGIFLAPLLSGFLILGMFAAGWFGMWMGLSCRKPAMASFWSVLFSVFVPFLCCYFHFISDIILLVFAVVKLDLDLRVFVPRQTATAQPQV